MKEKKLTLSTKAGCVRVLLICLCLILIFSFVAQLITTNGGRIKVEEISIDARGAILQADLYYPAGVTDRNKLPAVIFAHGAGVTKNNYRGIIEELARRGFVVMNINGYATGYSELPAYDESDMGIDKYVTNSSTSGTVDALNFVRSLKFVDATRIGLAGHSQGSRRMEMAAILDNGYLSFNDIMLNVLYEQFGKEISEEELAKNADDVAADKLSDGELELYNYIRSEKEEWFNTRPRALCLIGGDAPNTKALKEVEVAGHTVMRNIRINRAIVNGTFDRVGFYLTPAYAEAYYPTADLQPDKWYAVDDVTQTSEILGTFPDNIANNGKLQEALDARSVRLFTLNVESHSKNFMSVQTAADVVKYFEQTLNYNNGNLGASGAVPIDAYGSSHFVWRELCNALAMVAMLTALMPLAKLLCGTAFFAPCLGEEKVAPVETSKKRYWIVNGIAVVIGIIATLVLDKVAEQPWMYFHATQLHPLFFSWWMVPIFLAVIGVLSLIEVFVLSAIDKKNNGTSQFANTNVFINILAIIKSLILALIVIIAAFASMMLIKYLFNQDYRLWMFALTDLKVEHWWFVVRLAVIFLPSLLFGALALNYAPKTGKGEFADDMLAVLVNSLGVWIICLIDALLMAKNGAKWTFTYGYIFSVPVVNYVSRRLFRTTKNVWISAAVGALLLAWLLVGTMGYDVYYAQNFASIFFNN